MPIYGSTATFPYNIKQTGTGQIVYGAVTTTNGAITSEDIPDNTITLTKPAKNFMNMVTLHDDPGGHAVGAGPRRSCNCI